MSRAVTHKYLKHYFQLVHSLFSLSNVKDNDACIPQVLRAQGDVCKLYFVWLSKRQMKYRSCMIINYSDEYTKKGRAEEKVLDTLIPMAVSG